MLRFLTVRRLAVIDAIEVEFDAGLNVLTGETGAGKSILIEAVGLLLGGRASADLVRTGEENATVEAIFEIDGQEWLVRREVTALGRSRAFINGDLATAGALKDLAGRLIELHGQHEHQTLLDPATHLPALDAFAGLDVQRSAVATAYGTLRAADAELQRLRTATAERDARLDLVTFQLGELDKAAPQPGEDEELASLKQVLSSAERVERLCEESYGLLYDADAAVLASLGGVWRRVGELAELDPVFQPYLDARDAIKSQLEDLALHLRRYADSIEASPARLQQVEDRLALLERLKRKHGPTLSDVIARRETLRDEQRELLEGSDRIAAQLQARERAASEYLRAARALSDTRRAAAVGFGRAMEHLLAELAMGQTRFDVRFSDPLPEAEWSDSGIDRSEFFLSTNPGEDVRPLARIVSGGELSRVMLALKTLTAARRFGFTEAADRPPSAGAPGLVFDEVDAGIGGRVADIVGAKLRALGSSFQVLCITHLPQIAAYADTHFQIEKQVSGGRTRTLVRRLTPEARVEEIARMLGGSNLTAQIRASAREMLEARHGGSSENPGAGAAAGSEALISEAKLAKAKVKASPGESESGSPAKAKRGGRRPMA
jgi:DNA repair protein RecN (Recombination protein N)